MIQFDYYFLLESTNYSSINYSNVPPTYQVFYLKRLVCYMRVCTVVFGPWVCDGSKKSS